MCLPVALGLLVAPSDSETAQLRQSARVTTQASTSEPERLVAEFAAGPRATRLTCSGAPWAVFSRQALQRPSGYERRHGPAALALRRIAKELEEDGGLPQHGWYLLARRKDRLLFANGRATTLASVTLRRRRGRWSFEMSGSCEPRAFRDGLSAAPFRLATPPDGGDVVRLLVDDEHCASGRDARGRVLPPRIWLGRDAVTVTVHVRPPEGNQTCQGSPPTPVDLQLPERLGDRSVLDGGAVVPTRIGP